MPPLGKHKGKFAGLMSLSEMVEIPRLQAKRKSVMPAKAGIQCGGGGAKTQNLDSRFSLRLIRPKPCGGFAGKTEWEVDFQST